MALNTDEINQIAALAGLRLSPRDARVTASQMEDIVRFVSQLESFESAEPAVPELAVPEPAADRSKAGSGAARWDEARWNEASGDGASQDAPAPCLSRDQVLAEAPESWEGFLVVPRVLPRETR